MRGQRALPFTSIELRICSIRAMALDHRGILGLSLVIHTTLEGSPSGVMGRIPDSLLGI